MMISGWAVAGATIALAMGLSFLVGLLLSAREAEPAR